MTTIVLVRKNNEVVVAGDGQVSMGNTVLKSTASKLSMQSFQAPDVIKKVKEEWIENTGNVIYMRYVL